MGGLARRGKEVNHYEIREEEVVESTDWDWRQGSDIPSDRGMIGDSAIMVLNLKKLEDRKQSSSSSR